MRCKWSRGRLKVAPFRPSVIQNQIFQPNQIEETKDTKVMLNYLEQFVINTAKQGTKGLAEEYQSIPPCPDSPSATFHAFKTNMNKNRYSDVACVDATRVVLKIDEAEGDYIHANHIDNDLLVSKYICTQGPLANTIYDFWRMVYQERAEKIIMLCSPVEDGRPKCNVYWPANIGDELKFKSLIIKNNGEEHNSFNVVTLFVTANPEYEGEMPSGCKDFYVKLYRFTTWPDRGVPDKVHYLTPLKLLDMTRDSTNIIHCSAGIGRTGSLMVIEIALQKIIRGLALSVKEITTELRRSRCQCVQNEVQYLYVHRVLVENALQHIKSEKAIAAGKHFLADYAKKVGVEPCPS